MDGCPDDKRMTGKIAIYKSSETDISVCTNLGIENNTAVLLLEKILMNKIGYNFIRRKGRKNKVFLIICEQSKGIIIPRSQVQILPPPPQTHSHQYLHRNYKVLDIKNYLTPSHSL